MVYVPKKFHFYHDFSGSGTFQNESYDQNVWLSGASSDFKIARIGNQTFRTRLNGDSYSDWSFNESNGSLGYSFTPSPTAGGEGLGITLYPSYYPQVPASSDPSYIWTEVPLSSLEKGFFNDANEYYKHVFTLGEDHATLVSDLNFSTDLYARTRLFTKDPYLFKTGYDNFFDYYQSGTVFYGYDNFYCSIFSGSFVDGNFIPNKFDDDYYFVTPYNSLYIEFEGDIEYTWNPDYGDWESNYYSYVKTMWQDVPDIDKCAFVYISYSAITNLSYSNEFNQDYDNIRKGNSCAVTLLYDTSEGSDFSIENILIGLESSISNILKTGFQTKINTSCPLIAKAKWVVEDSIFENNDYENPNYQLVPPKESISSGVDFDFDEKNIKYTNTLDRKLKHTLNSNALAFASASVPIGMITIKKGSPSGLTEPFKLNEIEWYGGTAKTQQLRKKQRDDTPRIKNGPAGGGSPSSGQASLRRSRGSNYYI